MDDTAFTPVLREHNGKPMYAYYSGSSWEDALDGQYIDVINPSSGEVIGYAPALDQHSIDGIIEKLKLNQSAWEDTPLNTRIEIILRAGHLLRMHEHFFTELLVSEIGKTRAEARSEVLRSADLIEYYTKEVIGLTGEYKDSDAFPGFPQGRHALIERRAHGVVLSIAPFNYPINLAVSKIVPALLMGNAVLCKPPTQGTLVGLAMTKLFIDAGIPENTLSCVSGKGSVIGDYLVSHPGISMIAFTGSSQIGEQIAKKAGMIPLLFECGGNNPVVVFDDADMNVCVKEIVKGAFSYAGQRCTGIKYVLARPDVIDAVIDHVLVEMDASVKMGDPSDSQTKLVGPVISQSVAQEIKSVIDEAVAAGAVIVRGGGVNGSFVEPTILKHVTPSMNVVATEVFGPIVSFVSISSVDEAVGIINSSQYGLQASLFTRDEGRAIALASKIQVGTVQINGSPQRGPDHFPFMGIKKSGLGVQGIRYSLEAMSRLRSTVVNFPG